jgi:hypothetical protein
MKAGRKSRTQWLFIVASAAFFEQVVVTARLGLGGGSIVTVACGQALRGSRPPLGMGGGDSRFCWLRRGKGGVSPPSVSPIWKHSGALQSATNC